MPISYIVDPSRRVIFERWTGDISADDLRSYWRRYLADPEVMAIRRTLVDLRGSVHRFSGLELSTLVRTVVLPILAGRDWKTAVVLDEPTQFGMTRQYQVFAESFSRDAIFHDADAALEWLMRQEPDDTVATSG